MSASFKRHEQGVLVELRVDAPQRNQGSSAFGFLSERIP
jgi:hypothetical protein